MTDLTATAKLTRELIRFDTSNWGEGRARGEAECAEFLGERLRAIGLSPAYYEAAPRRTSVVARVPGRRGDLPALVVHGHTDVVPAVAEDWSVDPFAGVVRDGMIWGRGAVDMKDMDAMIVVALERILGSGRLPERELVVAFFADEENGGAYGSHHLVREHPELFAGATEALGEVGGYSIDVAGRRAYLLQTGEKALVWARLVARGPAAHGSRVVPGNAVTRLAEAVATIGRHPWPVTVTHTTAGMLDALAAITGAGTPEELIERTGLAAGFLRSTIRTTANPTVLTAGYKHNVVPDRAEALLDIRPFPGDADRVVAELRALLPEGVELEVLRSDVGLEHPFAGPMVDAVHAVVAAHDPGATVMPYLMPAGTDNKALSRLGITGYGFVPLRLPADLDFPGMFHGVDERVPLDALDFGTEVLADLLLG